MAKLTLLIGCPCSGKSTWVDSYILSYKDNKDLEILSADDIRKLLYGDASIQGGKEVWDLFYSRLEKAVSSDMNIIIDNTNVKKEHRKQIIDKCPNYVVEYVLFMTPLWKCLKRNEQRERKVPEEVIQRMYRTFKQNFEMLLFEPSSVKFIGEE